MSALKFSARIFYEAFVPFNNAAELQIKHVQWEEFSDTATRLKSTEKSIPPLKSLKPGQYYKENNDY